MRSQAEPESLLRAGLQALKLPADLAAPLLAYLAELQKWNAAYNLTAVRDPAEMVTRHLLDSLCILDALDAQLAAAGPSPRLIDVGAGAGLPGLIVAIARPQWAVAVLDSNGKKARFLRHAQRSLGLDNVEVIEARVEAHEPAQGYDGVLSRAFASLQDFVALSRHLLAPGGCWLAMKGRLDQNEAQGLPDDVRIRTIVALHVPGLDEQRHLVVASLAS